MFSTKLFNKLEKVILILRLYKNGFMKTLPVFSEFNMRDLLPLKVFCSWPEDLLKFVSFERLTQTALF